MYAPDDVGAFSSISPVLETSLNILMLISLGILFMF